MRDKQTWLKGSDVNYGSAAAERGLFACRQNHRNSDRNRILGFFDSIPVVSGRKFCGGLRKVRNGGVGHDGSKLLHLKRLPSRSTGHCFQTTV